MVANIHRIHYIFCNMIYLSRLEEIHFYLYLFFYKHLANLNIQFKKIFTRKTIQNSVAV